MEEKRKKREMKKVKRRKKKPVTPEEQMTPPLVTKGKYKQINFYNLYSGVGAMKKGDYMVHVFVEKAKEIAMPENSTVDPIIVVETLG